MFNLFFNKQIDDEEKAATIFLSIIFVCQIEHIYTIKRACQYEISYLSKEILLFANCTLNE